MFGRGIGIAVLGVFFGGCFVARPPQTGTVATGQPLAVVDDVKVWTTSHQEKVGQAVHKDSNGNTVGSTDVYAERTQVHTQKVWYGVQGVEQLPDEDFFRIAGDDASLQATVDMRNRARKRARRGQILMGGGAVAAIASLFVPNVWAKTALSLGGTLTLTGGWYLAYSGAKQMQPEHHAVPRSVAEVAARRYNENLPEGRTIGVGMSGSF